MGSSLKDTQSFPEPVRREIGHALYAAQQGETDPSAKPLKGFGGASVMEIAASFDGNTWRAIYTVRIRDAVYVLHTFQKKSKSGIATPKAEIELIRQRLTAAEQHDERRKSGYAREKESND